MTAPLLRVLAVDDELPALDELAYLLRQHRRVGTVLTAADGPQALRELERTDVDAVFLDVRMPGLSGLELARVLSRFVRPPVLVFVTAYDDHAVDAFELQALDYVLKPVRAERLAEAVRRVDGAVLLGIDARQDPVGDAAGGAGDGTGGDLIPVELGGTVRFVARSDVRFVEAHGDYARLHTEGSSHLVRVPLSTLEDEWGDTGFVRVHRSYLVNIRHIDELRLDGGHYTVRIGARSLQVSRRHSRELRDRLVRSARPGAGS